MTAENTPRLEFRPYHHDDDLLKRWAGNFIDSSEHLFWRPADIAVVAFCENQDVAAGRFEPPPEGEKFIGILVVSDKDAPEELAILAFSSIIRRFKALAEADGFELLEPRAVTPWDKSRLFSIARQSAREAHATHKVSKPLDLLPYIRDFQPDQDYPVVAEWWKAHGWSPVPLPTLPKLGVVAHDAAGTDLAAGWLYMDNSVGVCMLEWLVANPSIPATKSIRAINAITEFLSGSAKAMDYGIMLTTCRQEPLARLHERNGFTRTDEGMIHLIKILNPK